jgi:hypothetical protein
VGVKLMLCASSWLRVCDVEARGALGGEGCVGVG